MFSTQEVEVDPTLFVGNPSSLAYDWISKNLFWSDTSSGSIQVMKTDGNITYRKVILTNMGREVDCVSPVAIQISPSSGLVLSFSIYISLQFHN